MIDEPVKISHSELASNKLVNEVVPTTQETPFRSPMRQEYGNWAESSSLVDASSEIPKCLASNVLAENKSEIWLSEAGMPQWFSIKLNGARRHGNIVVRSVGWYCWHAYSSNPKEVILHVSQDGCKFKMWDSFVAQQVQGVQIFCCAPINADIFEFIAFEVVSTFGGVQTYMNSIYLYSEEYSKSPENTSLVTQSGEPCHASLIDTEEKTNTTPGGNTQGSFPDHMKHGTLMLDTKGEPTSTLRGDTQDPSPEQRNQFNENEKRHGKVVWGTEVSPRWAPTTKIKSKFLSGVHLRDIEIPSLSTLVRDTANQESSVTAMEISDYGDMPNRDGNTLVESLSVENGHFSKASIRAQSAVKGDLRSYARELLEQDTVLQEIVASIQERILRRLAIQVRLKYGRIRRRVKNNQ
jgi:hypothetical protein